MEPEGEQRYDTKFQKNPAGVEFGSCLKQDKKEQEESRHTFYPSLKTCGFGVLILLLVMNLAGTVVLWGTQLVDNAIIKDMVIENNTQTYDWWTRPPVKPLMHVRVFNYTNVERFMAGDDDKLMVVEAGPYVYRETMERVNVQFHTNGTVSYQEKRSFVYMPDHSTGNLSEYLVVPNMAFLGSASIMKDSFFVTRLSLSALFRSLDVKPFITVKAYDLFWGYEDPLFTMGRSLMAIQGIKDNPQNHKIGLLVARNGTGSSRVTIHTGSHDLRELGMIDRYNGVKQMRIWGSDECNKVDGTDGSMWPPHMVDEDAVLYMYMKDMCRKFPLVFKEYVEAFSGVRAMRFHPPRDVFATGDTQPDNACFCHEHSRSCPPAGVFNSSPCALNAPVMMSFPHFYLGDPALLENIDGLKPDAAKHDMFMDLHPKFGFPLAGESRFQVNIMVRKSNGISHLERFEDEQILPIAWFEVVVDQIPLEMQGVLHDLHFATHTIKLIFLWAFLITLLMVCLVVGRYAYTHYYRKSVDGPGTSGLAERLRSWRQPAVKPR